MALDPLYILVAFASGLMAQRFSLPPLIGYLVAGFGLHALGFTPQAMLEQLANLGVTLLLFVIGLKLNVKQLLKPEIWVGSLIPMVVFTVVCHLCLCLLALSGWPLFAELDVKTAALIGFTLSFSSTVVAVKMLEDRGELKSRHGQVTLGILVMQDLIAVIFLSASAGKWPSLWAFGLLLLPLLRKPLYALLKSCKHGEILPLAGFGFVFAGGLLFESVHMKADLGALVMGALLHQSPKANELAKSLMGFKDIFLIGFFLSIGFMALPNFEMLLAATVLLALIPFKAWLFFKMLTVLRLRGRTAFLSSFSLTNFSEFGLIVGVMSVSAGWLSEQWLVIIALTVSLSFVLSSMLSAKTHGLYARWQSKVKRFEKHERLPEDRFVQPDHARVLIIGTGRVGRGAYAEAERFYGDCVWGVDSDAERVDKLKMQGYQVIRGDAEDADFWENLDLSSIELMMLAIPSLSDMLDVLEQLKIAGFSGKISAIAKYEDERTLLLEAGADVAFNVFAQAGAGFAAETFAQLDTEYQRPECAGT
jgi:glutathione-regulated potassium-efflux system ancillary protein KefC